jgi:tetratricopeptide (TPR) repeat protein
MEMAQAMLQLGDTDGATAMLRSLVKNNHDNPVLAARVQQVFESASLGEHGRSLIERSRQEVVDINNQGVSLGREGRIEEGVTLLRRAQQELPDNETVLMNLCGLLIVHRKRGGPQEALEAEIRALLQRAQAINPANRKLQEYTAALAR